jgi:hypothetical protein
MKRLSLIVVAVVGRFRWVNERIWLSRAVSWILEETVVGRIVFAFRWINERIWPGIGGLARIWLSALATES